MSLCRNNGYAVNYTKMMWERTFAPFQYKPVNAKCTEELFCPWPRFYAPTLEECIALIEKRYPGRRAA